MTFAAGIRKVFRESFDRKEVGHIHDRIGFWLCGERLHSTKYPAHQSVRHPKFTLSTDILWAMDHTEEAGTAEGIITLFEWGRMNPEMFQELMGSEVEHAWRMYCAETA